MFGDLILPSLNVVGYNRRLSIVIILLASMAVLLVVTSVIAFVYVTRKGFKESNILHIINESILYVV